MKRIITYIIIALLLGGCSQSVDGFNSSVESITEDNESGLQYISDGNLQYIIYSFDFNYSNFFPGNSLSYKILWDGLDNDNLFGPSIGPTGRLYTYVTSYEEIDEQYYLLYIKEDLLPEAKEYMKTYESRNYNPHDYYFSKYDDEYYIDGKYLLAYKEYFNSRDENVRYYIANSLDDIKFNIDGYQLVFALRRKNATILENISTKKKVNRKIKLYKKEELTFDGEKFAPAFSSFSDLYAQTIFEKDGLLMQTFPVHYSSMNYSYIPLLGMFGYKLKDTISVPIVEEDNKKYCILPRSNSKIDYLDENAEFIIDEDIYREYKKDFLDAFVKYVDEEKQTGRAYFDYEKVYNIIH